MLEEILQSTRQRVEALRPASAELVASAASAPPTRGFAAALANDGLQIIAEIKRRSPSAGPIAPHIDPAVQAKLYETGGAAALSVLTEPHFFAGSLEDLQAARAAVKIPVLRKDFIVDELQLHQARVARADAVLLIVAALEESALRDLHDVATGIGLDVLVEAHNLDEVEVANRCGAALIGVNNRDLHTFKTDLATAETLASSVESTIRVAESGVSSPAGASRMAAAGY
ncbi:MAG: indole-3-glycerol-phosphate synthase, partial [Acidimicrobiia bacterium]|nr:indole-3-glycerol-phosphate synthase [Acidimicrobiia bacterium]